MPRRFPVIIGKTEKDLGKVVAALDILWPDRELFLQAFALLDKAEGQAAELFCNPEGEWALLLRQRCRGQRQLANLQVKVARATPEVRVLQSDDWLNDSSWVLS